MKFLILAVDGQSFITTESLQHAMDIYENMNYEIEGHLISEGINLNNWDEWPELYTRLD